MKKGKLEKINKIIKRKVVNNHNHNNNKGKEDMIVEIEIIEMIVATMREENNHRVYRIQENNLKEEVIQGVKVMVGDIKGSQRVIKLISRLIVIQGKIISIIMWIIKDNHSIIMDRIIQAKEDIIRGNKHRMDRTIRL